jgi:hypothetical protein
MGGGGSIVVETNHNASLSSINFSTHQHTIQFLPGDGKQKREITVRFMHLLEDGG